MNKKVFITAMSLLMVMSITGCRKKNTPENIANDDIPSGYQQSYTQGITGQLHNIGMGWNVLEEQTELGKLDLGKNGTLPECDSVGIQTSWALIEKTPGEFDWSLIDQTIDYWASQGKRINFRICTDSLSLPEVYFGAPEWINEAPYNVGYEEYQYSGDMMARVNDLTDPTYQRLFENFMDKLAERYVDNPYLDTVDIRGYGMYGEWHSGHSFKTMQERMDTLAYIIDEYQKRFAKNGIELWLSCSWDYQGINKDGSSAATYGNCSYDNYLDWSSIRHAMYLPNVGYRRDGLAGNGCTKYATDEKAISDQFRSGKKVSFCAEYFMGIARYKDGYLGMSPVEATDELLFKSHMNYSSAMGWVNSEAINIIEGGDADVFDRGNEKMGYRFKVEKALFPEGVKRGKQAHVLTTLSNSAVGRLTRAGYNVRLMLVDKNGKVRQAYDNKAYDLRILANGEIMNIYSDFVVDPSIADGEYTLAMAIVDKDGHPAIRFAQVGNYDEKVYPLGKVKVGNYKELKPFVDSMNYTSLNKKKLNKNSHYELTFEYTPSLKLKDYLMGDDNGFEVRVTNGKESITVLNWQDVSEEKAIKTVTFSTLGFSNPRVEIVGTGVYKDKIAIGECKLVESKGYISQFDANYDLLSTNNVWYSDNENADVLEEGINGGASIDLHAATPHQFSDALYSDPNLLKLKNNTSYTISFDTKGDLVGGNGCYYYLKLAGDGVEDKMIAEWYDRPDEPQTNKTYSFTTGSGSNLHLVFGVKNIGGYFINNINILENAKGTLVTGPDHPMERNVRPFDAEKQAADYVEGFENGNLHDSKFTYGFNRWGCLTNAKDEVISGNFSMSSRVESITYKAFKENNWFEFMYSDSKYYQFEPGARYKITFKYKVVEKIILNTDPDTAGYVYMCFRGSNGSSADVKFATNVEPGVVKNFTTYIYNYNPTNNNAPINNAYFLMGVFGRGVVVIDDILIQKAS